MLELSVVVHQPSIVQSQLAVVQPYLRDVQLIIRGAVRNKTIDLGERKQTEYDKTKDLGERKQTEYDKTSKYYQNQINESYANPGIESTYAGRSRIW